MHKLVLLCVVAAMLMIVALPVAADEPPSPIGACPDPIPGVAGGPAGASFQLSLVGEWPGSEAVDRNGDGWVCAISAGRPGTAFVEPTALIDNRRPLH